MAILISAATEAGSSEKEVVPYKSPEGFVAHPETVPSLMNKPIPAVVEPKDVNTRATMSPKEAREYYSSLDPEEREAQQEEDMLKFPSETISRTVMDNPILPFIKGLGGTAGKSQGLGLLRLTGSIAEGLGVEESDATNAWVASSIVDMNKRVNAGEKNYGLSFEIGSEVGRNLASIATAGYTGFNLFKVLGYETVAQMVDTPAKPGADGENPVGLLEGSLSAAMNVAIPAGVTILGKSAPYVLSGFKSSNIKEVLDPTTEYGKQNLLTLNSAIEYADKHKIRLSDLMVEGSSVTSDSVAFVDNANFFALREMFKGSDKVARQSIDTLQDIVTLGKKFDTEVKGLNNAPIVERQRARIKFEEEVSKLRARYKQEEGVIWGELDKNLPEQTIYMDEFKDSLHKTLYDEGADPTVVNAVDTIVFNRANKAHAPITKKIKELQTKKQTAVTKFEAWKETAGKNAGQSRYVKVLGDHTRRVEALDSKIDTLRKQTRMTPKDLLNTIKLINKKMNVPGGNLSLNDVSQMRSLRIAKKALEDKLTGALKDNSPQVLKMWQDAKALTATRASIFNAKQADESLILANALVKQDTNTVMNMFKDPDMGLQHLNYVSKIFGKESEATKSATSLFIRAKIGMIDDVSQFARKDALVRSGKADLNKVSEALADITPNDIKFMKKSLGDGFGRELEGFKSLVDVYSSIFRKVEKAASSKGTSNAFVYLKNNPSQVLSVAADAATYYTRKAANGLIAFAPRARAVGGAATSGALSDEEIGSKEWFGDVLAGGALGYASGIVGRHFLESQMDAVQRIIRRRGRQKEILMAFDKAITNIKTTAKSITDGKLMPPKN